MNYNTTSGCPPKKETAIIPGKHKKALNHLYFEVMVTQFIVYAVATIASESSPVKVKFLYVS